MRSLTLGRLVAVVVSTLWISQRAATQPTESCLDLDLMEAAVRVVDREWDRLTPERLQEFWPGSVTALPSDSLTGELNAFVHERLVEDGHALCGEYFRWIDDDGERRLGFVRIVYGDDRKATAVCVADRIVASFGPPENSLTFDDDTQDRVREKYSWMHEKRGAHVQHVLDLQIDRDGTRWIARVTKSRHPMPASYERPRVDPER